jgi:hypothetical protein
MLYFFINGKFLGLGVFKHLCFVIFPNFMPIQKTLIKNRALFYPTSLHRTVPAVPFHLV